jgi:hypothetical protein
MHPIPDRFECYERCVQSPRHVASFLRALYRAHNTAEPITLAEDFSGTCALSREWCAHTPTSAAICVDLDADALAWARDRATKNAIADQITFVHADCLADCFNEADAAAPSRDLPCDVCFVGNFSIGYAHDRVTLLRYLARTRERLLRTRHASPPGILVCDTYGGATAFTLGGVERTHPGPNASIIRYAWAHESADPATAMVTNSISLRVERDGDVIAEYPRAFEYRWRLWSIAELREAMLEVGFQRTSVYLEIDPASPPTPVTDPRQFPSDWVALVAAFA